MRKTQKAVYKPGELNRVRSKLGDINNEEAKRMAKILGGEIGVEKDPEPQFLGKKPGRIRRDTVELSIPGKKRKRPGRTVELADTEEEKILSGNFGLADTFNNDHGDDPSIQLKPSYFERIKMDRYASQPEFEIKNSMQVLVSILAFIGDPADNVNPRFINQRLNIYYNKINQLVNSTKTLLPKNNIQRSERLKKTSPFTFAILNVIRSWDIERIGSEIVKIQSHSHSARVSEFSDILRAIYKPLFILRKLDINKHIKEAYKLLYKLIYIESPMDNKEKNQELIRNSISYFSDIRNEVQFVFYPLLLKTVSDRWFSYEQFFHSRRNRFMSFIGVTENDQLKPLDFNTDQTVNENLEKISNEIKNEEPEEIVEEDPEEEAKKEREANEKKAFSQSIAALEMLFPKAGWDKLSEFPDLYPYFVDIYGLRRGYELIAPTDPLHQVAILMHIIEDLCVALRNVSFDIAEKSESTSAGASIADIINNWRRFIDNSFSKEYLPRLSEYCRILEHNMESRTSVFAKRTLNELRWAKRLYFLPFYKFESLGPPPFQKQDLTVIYGEIKAFRRCLTNVAAGIERGKRNGGDDKKARCVGIHNPWDKYKFEIPNPVSRHLDALLGQEKRNNAALIFFALSAVIVLDTLLNDENSWAYAEDRPSAIFRSVNGEGVIPVFGVDDKIDADKLFRDSLKRSSF